MAEKTDSSKKATIDRIGGLLTSGWKLLNDSCPLCHTSLLSKGIELRCPRCDLPVIIESIQEENFEEEDEEPIASFEELKREYDSRNKGKATASSKLAEKMLSGWTLLAETCPNKQCEGTPMMRLRDGPIICVSCSNNNDTKALPLFSGEEKQKAVTDISISPKDDRSHRFQRDDASVQIGQKLMYLYFSIFINILSLIGLVGLFFPMYVTATFARVRSH